MPAIVAGILLSKKKFLAVAIFATSQPEPNYQSFINN